MACRSEASLLGAGHPHRGLELAAHRDVIRLRLEQAKLERALNALSVKLAAANKEHWDRTNDLVAAIREEAEQELEHAPA